MAGKSARISSERTAQFLRRVALFLATLLSGGNLLIPRTPLLALLLLVFAILCHPTVLVRRELSRIWLLLVVVLFVATIGGEVFAIDATITRYANFLGGLALVGIYLDQPRTALASDALPIFQFFAVQAIATPFAAFLLEDLFAAVEYDRMIYRTFLGIFTYHDVVAGAMIKRPDGFFFEPGVLQIYLNIYLYIALFLRQRPRDIGLALFGVVATQSTTGLAIALVLLASWYLRRLARAGIAEKIIVAIFVPVAMLPMMLIAWQNYFNKTEGELRGSSWARQYDLITGLRVVQESPWFGIGFDIERYYQIAQRVGYRETKLDTAALVERGSTNGILSLAFTIGIPLMCVFLYGLYKQRFFPDRVVFGLVIFISLLGEALSLTPFFLMIFYSGLLTSSAVAYRVQKRPAAPGAFARPYGQLR